MRVFINNYERDGDQPVNINQLKNTPVISVRTFFDDALHIDSGDLTPDELDRLRPAFYRRFAETAQPANRFVKIHDAFQRLPDGTAIFPLIATAGVIYMVRNPLDVAVSYAHHNASSIDEAIDMMADPDHGLFFAHDALLHQLPQRLMTWSEHVLSWADQTDLPSYMVRYEDMYGTPLETFGGVVRFIGWPEDEARLEKALRFSAFSEMQKQEQTAGFQEKAWRTEMFFRKGRVGDWRDKLTKTQVERLIKDHGAVMERFGYLPL